MAVSNDRDTGGTQKPGRESKGLRVFLIGFMGCGKSYWGKLLSEKLQIPFFDLDEKLAEKEDKPIIDIFEQQGEEYFRLLEKDVLHLLTENHESFVMACGGGTACFYNNNDYMKSKGVTVWINCSVDCLHRRLVKERGQRPLIKDLSENALRSYIIKKYSDRKIFYQQAAVILQDDDVSLEQITQKIFHS
ncbi:MAG: shikimate kinase [Chitinophagaceae bacterium]